MIDATGFGVLCQCTSADRQRSKACSRCSLRPHSNPLFHALFANGKAVSHNVRRIADVKKLAHPPRTGRTPPGRAAGVAGIDGLHIRDLFAKISVQAFRCRRFGLLPRREIGSVCSRTAVQRDIALLQRAGRRTLCRAAVRKYTPCSSQSIISITRSLRIPVRCRSWPSAAECISSTRQPQVVLFLS